MASDIVVKIPLIKPFYSHKAIKVKIFTIESMCSLTSFTYYDSVSVNKKRSCSLRSSNTPGESSSEA